MAKSSRRTCKDVRRESSSKSSGDSARSSDNPARDSALSRAVQQIEKQFGKGAVMKLDGDCPGGRRWHSDRQPESGYCPGRRGCAAGAGAGDFRAGIQRQDHADAAHHRQCTEGRRRGGVY